MYITINVPDLTWKLVSNFAVYWYWTVLLILWVANLLLHVFRHGQKKEEQRYNFWYWVIAAIFSAPLYLLALGWI